MTPERWKLVEQLYLDALDLKPEDRLAFLSSQPNEELRREVESLLNFQEPGDKLLEIADPEEISLKPGAQLGPYEVTSTLGSGGMGVVYEATDTRLGRKVALKVSAHRFGERFEIEAKAIASINHPNVCTLFDVGPNFLVLELIEGETLAKRLQRGLLAPIEVAKRGAEIAHGIAAAHARGIVHRDLKPSNIMLTRAGVKVLDLGVAKFAPDGAQAASAGESILGTRVYMAPEQVAGLKCDARSDIYSLGLILCEMLTGKRAFDTSSETPNNPESAALRRVIRKCVASDPEERWQSAEDLATNLDWIAQGTTPPMPLARRLPLEGFAALVLFSGALWLWYLQRPASHQLEADFGVDPPQGTRIAARIPTKALIAVSPDGEKLVVVAQDDGGKRALYVRALKSDDYSRLDQTEGASLAFWSPDSEWIGFFANGHLKKIPWMGGPVQTITDVPAGDGEGAAWSPDGTVIFARPRVRAMALPEGPLFWVPASGGTASLATTLDLEHGEQSHSWPQFLPDGKRFQYL
jgi:eukaryotic-like serine/threonine-protein kinase